MGALILPPRKRPLSRRGFLLTAPAIIVARKAFARQDIPPHLLTAWRFTGAPIATLNTGSITGGSSYTNGTYTNSGAGIPLTGSISGAVDALASSITVSGGAITSVTLGFGGGVIGGIAGKLGATGYYTTETVTCANTYLGGTGSGWSVPIATVSSYAFTLPSPNLYGFYVDACGAGGSGGGGYNGAGGGGGGGGSGANLLDWFMELIPTGGNTLTISPGQPGTPGPIGTIGGTGTNTLISGAALGTYIAQVSSGSPGNPGLLAAGGAGGNGGIQGNGNGGASATIGVSTPAEVNSHYIGGSGGGGGGATASFGAAGGNAAVGPYGSATGGNVFAGGGGGGRGIYGDGGQGGSTNSAGGAPPHGFGGGGGGGFVGYAGGLGGFGMVELRA